LGQAVNHDIYLSVKFTVDRQVADASPQDYDALILPGGAVNPDNLRQNEAAVGFVRDFMAAGKPIGVICHGRGRWSRPGSWPGAPSLAGRACGPISGMLVAMW
jgi:putative intracellular protease/amidase